MFWYSDFVHTFFSINILQCWIVKITTTTYPVLQNISQKWYEHRYEQYERCQLGINGPNNIGLVALLARVSLLILLL